VVDTHHEYSGLAATYLPIAIAVYSLVALVLAFELWRFRARRRGAPSRRIENTPLELVYAGVLVAIVAFLVARTFSVETRVDAQARQPALRVDVVAAKWDWRFTYPGLRIATRDQLVVPSGRTVLFSARSIDVIHDFWVPALDYQHQVPPRGVERFDLVFPHPGDYGALCAWFCGLGHKDMRARVRALAPAAFDAWARREAARR
jgi:cytochrome c oxidase subunit 2